MGGSVDADTGGHPGAVVDGVLVVVQVITVLCYGQEILNSRVLRPFRFDRRR